MQRKRRGRRRAAARGSDSEGEEDYDSDFDDQDQAVMKKEEGSKLDRSNIEVLNSILKMIGECQEMGIETARKLENQNEQILRINGMLDETSESLEVSARSIQNMGSLTATFINYWRTPVRQALQEGKEKRGFPCCCCTKPMPEPSDEADHLTKGEGEGGTKAIEMDDLKLDGKEPPKPFETGELLVPDAVLVGADLKEGSPPATADDPPQTTVQGLLQKSCAFSASEKVLALYSPVKKGGLAKRVQTCVVLTQSRIIPIEAGQVLSIWFRFDLLEQQKDATILADGSGIEIYMRASDAKNSAQKIAIGDPKAAAFFAASVDRARKLVEWSFQQEEYQLFLIGQGLDDLMELSMQLNKGLKKSAKLIKKTDAKVDRNTDKIKEETGKLKALMK